MKTSPRRITLTAGQLDTNEGRALFSLLENITADGTIDITEAHRLRALLRQSELFAQLPSGEFLGEQLDECLEDGKLTEVEIGKLFKAALRVLPKESRETAKSIRQDLESREATKWRDEPSTERQQVFIRDLGGDLPPRSTKGEASELIERLLATRDGGADAITPRQEMVLRFWGRIDLRQSGKDAVSEWMDVWYAGDSDRLLAWEEWKSDNGDHGERNTAAVARVPVGAGDEYLRRLKTMTSEERADSPNRARPLAHQPVQGARAAVGQTDTNLPASSSRTGPNKAIVAVVVTSVLLLIVFLVSQ